MADYSSAVEKAFQVCPSNRNRLFFYYDELHARAGGEKKQPRQRIGGRMISAAVKVDVHVDRSARPSVLHVSYGASIFKKDSPCENWNKRDHRKTAQGRLIKRPVTFDLEFDASRINEIVKEWSENVEQPEFMECIRANNGLVHLGSAHRDVEVRLLKESVVESHVRDYILEELKKQVRRHIHHDGTCGKRL